jgi:hypothetical protein
MRTVPITSAMRPTPTPAMSRAMASGTVPSNEKNVTRTGRVFCNMKMTSTINRSAAMQMPTQTAPARERGVFTVGPVTPTSAAGGAAAGL